MVSQKLHSLAKVSWDNETTWRHIWPDMDISRTEYALNPSIFYLRNFIAVIKCHWPLLIYVRKLEIPYKDICESCRDAVKEKTIRQLVCHCLSLGSCVEEFLDTQNLMIKYVKPWRHRSLVDSVLAY